MPSDLDAPWEPRTFKVGDRVRVRLSGECTAYFCWDSPINGTNYWACHEPDTDGATGTITEIDEEPSSPDCPADEAVMAAHRFVVMFDVDVPLKEPAGYRASGGTYAALELEPLEDNRA